VCSFEKLIIVSILHSRREALIAFPMDYFMATNFAEALQRIKFMFHTGIGYEQHLPYLPLLIKYKKTRTFSQNCKASFRRTVDSISTNSISDC
jgi:hypothetical protein